jgi:hypothetical protein
MHADELIADKEQFLLLRTQCEQIIDTEKRLPDFVFRRPFARYYAAEYAHIHRSEFAALLRELSEAFKDETVSFLPLDPAAGDKYFRHSAFYGLISFASSMLPARYVEVMPIAKRVTTVLAGTNLGVLWGSSLQWGIFADRISWELMVIATQKDVDVSGIVGWPCFTSKQVASYIASQYHNKDPSDLIAEDFNRKFLANYSI